MAEPENPQFSEHEREFLDREASHFFQAELNHEQRASWLLGLASGLLALVLAAVVGSREGKIGAGGFGLLVGSASALVVCMVLALVALWPVSGHSADLWNPFRRLRDRTAPRHRLTVVDLSRRHYTAHRLRAEVKATRVARALLLLLAGLVLAFAGLLRSVS